MLVKVNSVATFGMEVVKIVIEVNVANKGFPSFDIVGLPGREISESRHRIVTALANSGLKLPSKKIVINLAPADIPKKGAFYDLPIAVGLISAVSKLKLPKNSIYFGELSLDGSLRYTSGSFLVSLCAKENDINDIFVPFGCAKEASSIYGQKIHAIKHLGELIKFLSGENGISVLQGGQQSDPTNEILSNGVDFHEVIGQEKAKRVLEIAAAGAHNIMLQGPPGTGKTLLSKAFGTVLPPLTEDESIEVTKIHSIKGEPLVGDSIITYPPYRAPHHTISYSGMIGGGSIPQPGEISLAHRGVLFMDEFAEFSRRVLEALRQPIEDGIAVVSRSKGSFVFPSKFILLAASNPCPCGNYGHPRKQCICSNRQILNYKKKISGPIADRIDLFVFVNPVDVEKLSVMERAEASSKIKERIVAARQMQFARFENSQKKPRMNTNSEMTKRQIEKFCVLDIGSRALLDQAARKLDLSARSYFRLIKTARTIADLAGSESILKEHIAESVQYRY